MGDGRYYSVGQFTNTLMMLIMVMLMTIDLVAIIYKQGASKINRWLIGAYAFLYVSLILRFIEGVILPSNWHKWIANASQMMVVSVVLFMGVFLMGLLLGKRVRGANTFGNLLVPRRMMKLTGLVFLLLCLSALTTQIFLPAPWVDYSMLIFIGCLAYLLHWLLGVFEPYSISYSVFLKAKDLILDYVFIYDRKGTLIYQNNHSECGDFFDRQRHINPDLVEEMFDQPVEIQTLNGKTYIKYTDLVTDTDTYFTYSLKPLTSNGKEVGGILTFTDVSGLVGLLERLNKEQKDSESVNKELKLYAKIVYQQEKEREIDALLKDIAQNQEISMLTLKDEMLNLQNKVGEAYENDIHQMIKMAKENLADVRRAVSTFRAYYGGHDD